MEDERIIELYFDRDEKAISETAMKFGAMIRAIAYNILRNRPDSEECENDTYNVAWNKMPPERPGRLAAFLGRIARNVAFDKYDYNKAARRNTDFDIALSEIEDFAASDRSVESEVEQRLLAKSISSFLRGISYTKRTVFIRRYWYCDTVSQISDRYGYSESKVKSMLMRTRNDLKKYLRSEGADI